MSYVFIMSFECWHFKKYKSPRLLRDSDKNSFFNQFSERRLTSLKKDFFVPGVLLTNEWNEQWKRHLISKQMTSFKHLSISGKFTEMNCANKHHITCDEEISLKNGLEKFWPWSYQQKISDQIFFWKYLKILQASSLEQINMTKFGLSMTKNVLQRRTLTLEHYRQIYNDER